MTSTPLASLENWSVQVFRWTPAKGWQVLDNVNGGAGCTCTLKRGCVEIRKLRLRIRLDSIQDTAAAAAATTTSRATATPLVTQRKDTILLSMRRGAGAIVLKFRNRTECLAFSDRLVSLNSLTTARNSNSNKQKASQDTMCTPQKQQKHGDVLSYIVRLLHDDAFLGFCDELEQCLAGSQDGASILAALQTREKSYLPQ